MLSNTSLLSQLRLRVHKLSHWALMCVGLDSTTAMHLLSTLRDLAKGGRAIVTTIHQPSSRLFQQLDKLLLLSKVGMQQCSVLLLASVSHRTCCYQPAVSKSEGTCWCPAHDAQAAVHVAGSCQACRPSAPTGMQNSSAPALPMLCCACV